jgi:hypothetical protein
MPAAKILPQIIHLTKDFKQNTDIPDEIYNRWHSQSIEHLTRLSKETTSDTFIGGRVPQTNRFDANQQAQCPLQSSCRKSYIPGMSSLAFASIKHLTRLSIGTTSDTFIGGRVP